MTNPTFCTVCDEGYYSDAGSTKCTECGSGMYGNEKGEQCKPCEAGKYRTGSMVATVCQDCIVGFYQRLTGQASCLPCIRKSTGGRCCGGGGGGGGGGS